jgi:hypothetical protein
MALAAAALLWATGAALALPLAWLLLQALRAGPAPHATAAPDAAAVAASGTLAVLVPAHDEAEGIAATVAGLRAQLRPGDRLLVVADNCTDDTAARAARAGAQVTERTDPLRRGKGHALAHGLAGLGQGGAPALASPEQGGAPALVAIVDADCTLSPGALDHLRATCAATGRPVQALYLMDRPDGVDTPGLRIAQFAWRVKNQLRPRAGLRLGVPCGLFGTGMVFPWADLQGVPLASGHLAEDMELWAELVLRDRAPRFCEAAVVRSSFPVGDAAQRRQRARWEQGHLQVMASHVPRLLGAALRQRRWAPLGAALDVAVPPLSLLLAGVAAWALLAAGAAALGVPGAAVALWAGLWLAGGTVVTLWWKVGRGIVGPADLLAVPGYALRKLPVYLDLLRGRSVAWVRTARGRDPHDHGH